MALTTRGDQFEWRRAHPQGAPGAASRLVVRRLTGVPVQPQQGHRRTTHLPRGRHPPGRDEERIREIMDPTDVGWEGDPPRARQPGRAGFPQYLARSAFDPTRTSSRVVPAIPGVGRPQKAVTAADGGARKRPARSGGRSLAARPLEREHRLQRTGDRQRCNQPGWSRDQR